MQFRVYTEFFMGIEGYPNRPVLLDDKERAKPLLEVNRPMQVGDHLIKIDGSIEVMIDEKGNMIVREPSPREMRLPRSWNDHSPKFHFRDRAAALS